MIIDKSIKCVTVANTDIQRIMHGGGILWQKSIVPGPTKLIGGNSQAGFYGEVPASDFITGDELARRVGLTAGKSQYSDEPWLKFSYLGKVEFVAKKTYRYGISWYKIKAANAVYGNRTIDINGKTYKVRLIKGKTEGKQDDQTKSEGTILHGSEFNKLLLPIHKNAPSNWGFPKNVNSPTENWGIGYTDADLLTERSFGNGTYTWCQEFGGASFTRIHRAGYGDISYVAQTDTSGSYDYFGWRPVLELVN